MKGVKAVIFDFDGVLVESVDVKTRAFAEMYRSYGEEIEKLVIAHHLEHGGLSRYEKFRYYEEQLLGQPFSSDKEKRLADNFSRKVKDAVVEAPFVPGAYQFLLNYHEKLSLFVASGTPEEELKEIISRRDISRFFVSIHGAPAKKAEILRNICELYKFDNTFVLMVGDSQTDYEGAAVAGIPFIGRVRGNKPVFPPHIPVIPDLTTLHQYLK
jgi:HAD superfamily hydrolase (TIGR01549 family)